jgi:4-amino-4-deoxy-L-arabinose transferase-like glycosyltransferase
VFFIYLAIFAYLRVRDGDRRWWYVVSVSCALGFMVKSFASLFAPAAIAFALIVDRQVNETLRAREFWYSILAGLAVIVPWHATMLYRHGSAFVNEYFYYHVWSRTVTALEGHSGLYWFYLREIWAKMYPWWSIAPFAVIFNVWLIKRRNSSVVLLALMVFVFAFYTAAQTKSTSYILPVYPALALLISDLFTWLWNQRRAVIRVAVILVCVCFAYEAIGKIRAYYVRIEEEDEAVRDLATQAAAQGSSSPLIVYSRGGEFDPQSALFYSNKRIVQATGGSVANSGTLYHNNKPLADVTGKQPSEIIMAKDDVEPLLVDYSIEIMGQSHNMVYAKIRKK